MQKQNIENKIIIAGSPKVGEGNIAETLALISYLELANIDIESFFPNSLWVNIGRIFHQRMSGNLDNTQKYATESTAERNSPKTLFLKRELKREAKKMLIKYPNASAIVSPQSMLIEEAADLIDTAIMICPDTFGKDTLDANPTKRQKKINYFVWNKEAYNYFTQTYDADKIQLIRPIDPKRGYDNIDILPFQEALQEPKICFIKLSGSGGPTNLINKAINGLWENSAIRSIVFPGTEKTNNNIIKSVGDRNHKVDVQSSLDAAVFYNQTREIISGEQMMLTYPSEQSKHLVVLSSLGISPNVCWLPPRGKHEYINLAMSIHDGFSNIICAPQKYHREIQKNYNNVAASLNEFGVDQVKLEFVTPENITSDHFKQSPDNWQSPKEAINVGDAFKNVLK